ncbi:MAG: hypothetical protein ACR2O3_14030 [Rhizobiaceae bacterium]
MIDIEDIVHALSMLCRFEESKNAAMDCLERSPKDVRCYESLVRALGEVGTREQATNAAKTLLLLSPGYTVSEYVRRVQNNRSDTKAILRLADGLRKAGIPE